MIWFLIFLVVVQQFRIWNLQASEQIWIDQYKSLLKRHNDANYARQEKN
jgi:hypothetical protein